MLDRMLFYFFPALNRTVSNTQIQYIHAKEDCTDMMTVPDTQLSDSFRFGSIIEAMKMHVCWVEVVSG